VFGSARRDPSVTEKIHELRSILKGRLYDFVKKFDIELLIVQNAITIPMNIPLGLAVTEFISETMIPVIAHHHDFYWERDRFAVNAVGDYLRTAFPPNLPTIKHVVINSAAQEELAHRTGISSSIIPNVLDFENPPLPNQGRMAKLREAVGLSADDIVILQPTRIVRRKGIEHAVELVGELNDPRCKLLISHEAGDEGFDYMEWLVEHAAKHNVDLRVLKTRMGDPINGQKKNDVEFSLWDIYPIADFVTYPSLYEGFGNAFLEAVYFRKPILINRYSIFARDIEPKGFDLIAMDGYLTGKNVRMVREVLENEERRNRMVEHNYAVASRFFSYAVLRMRLRTLLSQFFGDDPSLARSCPILS
jgi:glycosyltransferase involved in cell wall biosynthesis